MRIGTRRAALVALALGFAAGVGGGCELDEALLAGGDGMFYLRIVDAATPGCAGNEPGADVDAIALEVDGSLVYAGWARFVPPGDGGCPNGFTNAADAQGAPELFTTSGFLSLGGGVLVVAFLDAAGSSHEIVPGDRVRFFESGSITSERISIAVGPTENGPWTNAAANVADGFATLTFAAPADAAGP